MEGFVEQQQAEVFLRALKELLPAHQTLSDQALTKKIGKEKLAEALGITFELIKRGCRLNVSQHEPLTQNEQYGLVSQILRAYERYITKVLEIPFTPNTVVGNLHLLEYSVNLSFPGYVNAGLLRYVVRRRTA